MNTVFSSKFFKIIKTLSEEEFKSFETWLRSPWCNTNKNLIRLVEKTKKYHPDYENGKLSKEKLFRQILPNGKFSDRRMNNLLSEAYLAAERFFIFQNLDKDKNLQKDLLTKEWQSRHLEEWFFRDSDKELAKLEYKDVKDWEDHLQLLKLHRRVYHHPNQNPRMQPGGVTIVKMGEQMDLLYLLEKAAIINEMTSRNRILKNENHNVEKELKKWREVSEGVEHPAIEFYRKRFNYSKENMLEQYLELRKGFLNGFERLNEKEQKVHLLSLLNDTTTLVRSGAIDITEFLPLFKLGLETGIILYQGNITRNTYVAIVAASNTKKDFRFTREFINSYTKRLDKHLQTDAFNWALAHTAYYEQKLTECLEILLGHDFKILYFLLVTKILTTQAYFDLHLANDSYQSYLFNYFDSFEKWLTREKFRATFTKKSYLRFVQKCRALAKYYSAPNFQAEKVDKLLENESNIQALNWLNQKKNEIIAIKER